MSTTLRVDAGDLFINPSTGSASTIYGFEKVSQDIAEVLLSTLDTARNYGARLQDISQLSGVSASIEQLVSSEIAQAVTRLQSAQQDDDSLTPEEAIAGIDYLVVKALPSSASAEFFLAIRTQNGQQAQANFSVSQRPANLSHLFPNLLEGIHK